MAENLKELWHGWDTVEQIGEGSFGAVYKIARQIQNTTEYAALKVISIPRSDSELRQLREDGYDNVSLTAEFSERLNKIQNEYALLAQMKGCTNVVSCEDIRTVQQSNGVGWDIYIKMELLVPLKKALGARITEKQVIRLGMDMCNALMYCERLGVVHRDIKPENIFASKDGNLYKLGDFGIARTVEHTTMGTKTGTYEYMAPEVYNNRPYSTTADIYSLGLVMYWMLNDRAVPFFPRNVTRVTMDQRAEARNRRFGGEPIPVPAHGSQELKRIVLKACAFDPAQRYATAAQMREELEEVYLHLRMQEKGIAEKKGAPGAPAELPEPPRGPIQEPLRAERPEPAVERIPEVAAIHPADGSWGRKTKKGRILPAIAIFAAILAAFFGVGIGISSAMQCKHIWQEATCTAPRTCTQCGETEDEALGHQWKDATCDAPKTCTVCGAEEGEPLAHDWKPADCELPKTCTCCGLTEGEASGHKWKEADCATPKTCTACGKTEGKALGHDWQDADCTRPVTCSRCGEKAGGVQGHSWKDADCTTPKTCTVCGVIEGKSLGHKWANADCTSPKTCTVCGATEGKPLGHKWANADCTSPKTCTVCGATEGKSLGHKWKNADCFNPKTCTVCGAIEGKALEHKWREANCTHPKTCTQCGSTIGNELGHTWSKATCLTPETCKDCGETRGTKNKNAHEWEKVGDLEICSACKTPKWSLNLLMADQNDSKWNELGKRPAFESDILREQVITITFLDTMADMPENAWDVSRGKDGSVMAWAVKRSVLYDLYIAADGGIAASNCCGLFAGYTQLTTINFNKCFHTEYVREMRDMFSKCVSLVELDVSGFNTSQVEDMGGMFASCKKLKEIDVSAFDTSRVRLMDGMFSSCSSLTALDVSGFNTAQLCNVSAMFSGVPSKCIQTLELDHWNLANIHTYSIFMDSWVQYKGRPWKDLFEK